MKAVCVFLLLMTVTAFSVAEEVALGELLNDTGTTLHWDSFLKHGLLVKGSRYLQFSPDAGFLLLDFREKVPAEPITMRRGEPVFPESSAKIIKNFFTEPLLPEGAPYIGAIILDPGHGGRDAGAIASHNVAGKTVKLEEKHLVLDVSRQVFSLLQEAYPDKQILLTRDGDSYPSLEDRVVLANSVEISENAAIIYVSIHANAAPFNSRAKGFEVWYLPPEYRRDLLDPDSVEDEHREILPILNTMLEEEFTVESILLARSILAGMDGTVGKLSPNRGLKEQSWYVVRNAKMPSVLVELGFITNRDEAVLLMDNSYLKKVARGIYNGIADFIRRFESPRLQAE